MRILPAWLRTQLCWVLPALAAGFAVSYQAARPGPWRDEIASWSVATRTVDQIFALGRNIDGVLVPYYLFLHYWIGWFGDSAIAMRVPSIIAMTGTAAVVALLGRRWWGNTAGLLGGLLFAVMPAVSRYGQEIRGYALATLFVALATLLLAIALDRSRWWTWTGYGLCVALAGLSHLLSLMVLAGHVVMVLAAIWRSGRWRALWWVLAVAGAAGVVLPLTRNGLGQQSNQLNWLETATPRALADVAGSVFVAPILGGAVPGLAIAALRRKHATPAAVLWAAVLLPVGLLYAYDQLVAPIFVSRYLLFAVPLLCALAGAGLIALRLPLALAAVVALGAIGLPSQQGMRRAHSSFDFASAADVILDNQAPGDGIIYAPRDGWQATDLGVDYYLRDRAPRDLMLASDEVTNASLWATECADAVKCLGDTKRIWVMAADNIDPVFRATATNQLTYGEKAVLKDYDQLAFWRVSGFTVTLFVRED
ncbi:glycosyltransferase family 39 protein [Paractinoplanes toevensis]|uniref:glycosyltransferase family 39 protein n=1 Tax=Paractinoplanes toevensis TaxID=571911 RepID=UPI001FEBFB5E|nr:glycosyltransferase family 39 protein [Actinoplanes toevensis]